jgi:hypothetical protein
MRSRLAGSLVVTASALVIVCCSSGSYSEAEGAEGGPCYANNTCNAELVCASGRCVRIDQAGDAGTGGEDASSPDVAADTGGNADAGADAADDGATPCTPPSTTPPITCENPSAMPTSCGSGAHCCVDDRQCQSTNCGTPRVIECMSQNDCNGGTIGNSCCALAVKGPTGETCQVVTTFQKAFCRGGGCTGSEVELCTTGGVNPCEAPRTCKGILLEVDFGGDGLNIQRIPAGACL